MAVLAASAPDIMNNLQDVNVPVLLLVTLALSSVALPLLTVALAAAPGVTTSGMIVGVLGVWYLHLLSILLLGSVVLVVGLEDITTIRKDVDMPTAVLPLAAHQRQVFHVLRCSTLTVAAVAQSHSTRVCPRISIPGLQSHARPRWSTIPAMSIPVLVRSAQAGMLRRDALQRQVWAVTFAAAHQADPACTV